MAECNLKSSCLFYKQYKDDYAAKEAFVKVACDNENIPCARRIWLETKGDQAPANYAPSGVFLGHDLV